MSATATHVLLIAHKEMQHNLNSLLGYVLACVFLMVLGYPVFWADSPTNIFLNGQADLRPFFNILPLVLLVFVPAVAMRAWAEERRQNTLEVLLACPITETALVLGKFLGNLLLIWISLALTLVIPILVDHIGDLDWGPVWGAYLGSLFLSATYLACTQWIGTFTQHQILAFVFSFCGLGFFTLFHQSTFNLHHRFQNLARGVVDTTDLIFFISLTIFFLLLNVLTLRSQFWRK